MCSILYTKPLSINSYTNDGYNFTDISFKENMINVNFNCESKTDFYILKGEIQLPKNDMSQIQLNILDENGYDFNDNDLIIIYKTLLCKDIEIKKIFYGEIKKGINFYHGIKFKNNESMLLKVFDEKWNPKIIKKNRLLLFNFDIFTQDIKKLKH